MDLLFDQSKVKNTQEKHILSSWNTWYRMHCLEIKNWNSVTVHDLLGLGNDIEAWSCGLLREWPVNFLCLGWIKAFLFYSARARCTLRRTTCLKNLICGGTGLLYLPSQLSYFVHYSQLAECSEQLIRSRLLSQRQSLQTRYPQE